MRNSDDGDDLVEDAGVGRYDENLLDGRQQRLPRQYADEELDRYGEASMSRVSLLRLHGLSSGGGSSGGVRRTPRRVPIRPNNSGRGGIRRWEDRTINNGASPRANRGQLVVSQSLSAR